MQARSLFAAAALAAAAIVSPVYAQDNAAPKDKTKGFYVTAGVGGSWAGSANTTYNNPTFSEGGTIYGSSGTSTGNTPLNGGVAVEAGAGYDFGNNIRAELTYLYNNMSLSASTLNLDATFSGTRYTGTINPNTSGSASTNSVMLSGYYDIQTKTKFTPYVGAGIGYTSVSLPSQNRVGGTYTVNGVSGSDGWIDYAGGSGSAFGYQAKVGVSYAVSKPADVYVEGTYQGNTGTTINNLNLSALNLFGVRAGLRYRFGS
jgi:opacity protein-like surface antigen